MVACTFTQSRSAAFSSPGFEAKHPMARKKISTTIYITPEQNERLKLLHERTKVPVAVYIREGIDLVLERHRDDLPGQLSLAAANDSKK
jgi:predicted DNA-binding protein